MSTSRIIILIIFHVIALHTHAQQKKEGWIRRYVNSILNDTTDAGKATLTIYPTFAYAPETGIELGASTMKLFYAKGDTLNRLSELQAFTFFTFNAQYGLFLENAIYGDQDKWFFLGETKVQQFPLFYYGIGPDSPEQNPALVDAFNIYFRQRVLRKVRKNFFIGPEIDYQLISGVDFVQPDEGQPHPIPRGGEGTGNMGLGVAMVYDNRHNVLNVRKGFFGEISYLGYTKGFASDYSFGGVNVDFRSFHPVGKRNVLAWQIKGNFLNGDIPFNQLALLGGDRIMRGYYQGRYRDNHMLTAQVEYRMLPFWFSKRLGASVFAATGAVAPKFNAFQLRNAQTAYGIGLRYLLFPNKDIYIRFDLAFTREGSNLYIFNGEAF